MVTGFPEDGMVRIEANTGALSTRANGVGSQYEGSTLGLFIDYGSSNNSYNRDNIKWSKDDSGQWTPERQMLWKDDKTGSSIYAYAPYVDGSAIGVVNFEIPSDQSAGTMAADFVSWARTGFVPDAGKNNDFSTDGKILISFSHRLVKMTFNFEKGTQFGSDVTISSASLLGTTSKVECDITGLEPSKVTAASDAVMQTITLHKVNELKYEAVIFPGDGQKAGAKMLAVIMSDGTPLYYTIPATGLVSGGLQPGSAYEMKMRLGKDKIEVADVVSVDGWTTDSETTLPGGEAQFDSNADVWDGTIAAGFAGGTGLETDPYLIASAAQLAYIAQQVNGGNTYQDKYFRLVKDLVLNKRPWTPIGTKGNDETSFRGNFDGDNHTIYGLKIVSEGDSPNDDNKRSGLFGFVNTSWSGATDRTYIKNLRILGADVTNETQYSGILCGSANNVLISGVEVSGIVTASGFCGGIVGLLQGSNMENCKVRAQVKSASGNVGGLCGDLADSEVFGCSVSSSEIIGESIHVGGLCGMFYGRTIRNCTVDAYLKGECVGGLIGATGPNGGVVMNCTMTGTVVVIKENGGGSIGELDKSSFEACGFDGYIVKDGENVKNVGAAIGKDESGLSSFTDCWYNADKTNGLDLVGAGHESANYNGIEEKHLGK